MTSTTLVRLPCTSRLMTPLQLAQLFMPMSSRFGSGDRMGCVSEGSVWICSTAIQALLPMNVLLCAFADMEESFDFLHLSIWYEQIPSASTSECRPIVYDFLSHLRRFCKRSITLCVSYMMPPIWQKSTRNAGWPCALSETTCSRFSCSLLERSVK